jgi:UPF0716 protein FxsA
LVLVVLAIAEFAIFVLAATQVHVLLLMLAMAAVSAWGVVFLFRQTAGVLRSSLTDLSRTPGGVGEELGDRGMRVLAGLLLAFPGFLTGVLGGFLLLPPVRAAARPVVGSRLGRLVPPEVADLGRAFRRRDVLDVDAVRKDQEGTNPKTAAPPELR